MEKLKVDAQEQVMGRTKLESIELDDEVKPKNSHVARTVVEDNKGEELAILRHSLPYGDGRGDQGLFFIAYTNDLSIIDSMLGRACSAPAATAFMTACFNFRNANGWRLLLCAKRRIVGRSFGKLSRKGLRPLF